MLNRALTKLAMRFMVFKGENSLKHLEKLSKYPMNANERLLKKIIKTNRLTEYGKLHHFEKIKTIDDFKNNVPINTYEDFAPFIERMKEGETGLITASKVLGYSRTSGSSGVPKYIPATGSSLTAYVKYTWTRALALGARELKKQGKRYKPGRGVFLSPATNECLPDGTLCSNIAEIGARRYGIVYPYILAVPDRNLFDVNDGDYVYNIYRFALMDEDISFIFSVFFSINVSQIVYLQNNWQLITDDIEKGTINETVNIKPELRKKLEGCVRPMPERAAYLRKQFEQGFDSTIFKRIWPNLTVISSIGNASFKPAADYIRSMCDGIYFDFSIYGASEGLVASCYELESTDMQLLADSCFYEFIPFGDESGKTLTLDEVKEGEKYELLITTQAGLYRYRLKDVIEVKGFRNKIPLISFVYRKGQLFNIAGEKFSEEDARNTIEMFCRSHGVDINNWIFYQDDSVVPGRYCLLLEEDPQVDTDEFIDEIEEYMGQCNKRYPSQREKGFIGRLTVARQKPGAHDEWKQICVSRGASVAQVKPVHSLDNEEKRKFFLSRIEN